MPHSESIPDVVEQRPGQVPWRAPHQHAAVSYLPNASRLCRLKPADVVMNPSPPFPICGMGTTLAAVNTKGHSVFSAVSQKLQDTESEV